MRTAGLRRSVGPAGGRGLRVGDGGRSDVIRLPVLRQISDLGLSGNPGPGSGYTSDRIMGLGLRLRCDRGRNPAGAGGGVADLRGGSWMRGGPRGVPRYGCADRDARGGRRPIPVDRLCWGAADAWEGTVALQ